MNGKLQRKLVSAARSGDLECFGKLCEQYYSTLAAIAYSVLSDRHLAEDAAQATFAKALTSLPKLENIDKFAHWLARICRNTATDMLNKRSAQYTTDDLSQVQAAIEKDDTSAIVRKAISKLAPEEKEIICLRYYDRMSYQQMSEILGLSKPAINGRLKRIKQKMAEYLERNNFSEFEL